ncbi:hypothetical protein AYO44_16575 [Planctomycetaceae bacterium SCGC AG-212-F19]|nr:hypothetical protein AYO44_16575 [Planctomycetaceae bacterium SCGC AG-212-F19]
MAEEFHFVFGTDGPVRVGRDAFAEHWPYCTRSPAWYAARHAHNIGCLNPERWSDKPELYAWLKELVSILVDPELVVRYRQELLTHEELEAVRREQADIEENGW